MIDRPAVFLDADVIFAGAAPTEYGASDVVLCMGEISLLLCVTSQQAVTEVERNLAEKLPEKVPTMQRLISRCLTILPDPMPHEIEQVEGLAEAKDLPILAAAVKHGCRFFLSFNTRDYWPPASMITVQRPGEFLATVRALLARLGAAGPDSV